MVESMENDKSLDLDSLTIDELGRKVVGGSETLEVDLSSELQGPHNGQRCDSSRRELLNNCFSADD